MRKYNFEKAKQIIELEKETIESVSMGMHEDWFWTAETVYENGEYTKLLEPNTNIGGIQGSVWATPCMRISYIDGTEKCISCYQGEKESAKPSYLELGCLSSPCQDNMPDIID
ncbi:MAG TPA: hypothetical protein VEF53_18745 [Patescibacteria group bacterium]|nr:hypothetical protein [Patescibacteria group bacterium]